MRSGLSRSWRSATLLGLFLVVPKVAAAQTYTGAQVKAAIEPSVDILKDHVAFLAQQDRYDSMLGYFVFTDRFSPMRFASDDGSRTRGIGNRVSMQVGGGFGSTTTFGMYGGAWMDAVTMGPDANSTYQGILFIGAAVYGFQLTYAAFVKDEFSGVDPYGNFGAPKGGVHYYSYVPGGGIYKDQVGGAKDTFMAYHSSGASLVVVRDTPPTGGPTVREVRAQLQPLKNWLDARVGLPVIAFQKLSAAKAYGDFSNLASTSVEPPSTGLGDPYELEFGSDDVGHLGIRAHALFRVSPTASFRRAELGAYHDFGPLTVAMRSFAFNVGGTVNLSADAFARVAVNPVGKKGELGWPFYVSASYSYNSPESATFVPLPKAQVFGLQMVLGVPELAKQVVPIVRPIPSKGGDE